MLILEIVLSGNHEKDRNAPKIGYTEKSFSVGQIFFSMASFDEIPVRYNATLPRLPSV